MRNDWKRIRANVAVCRCFTVGALPLLSHMAQFAEFINE